MTTESVCEGRSRLCLTPRPAGLIEAPSVTQRSLSSGRPPVRYKVGGTVEGSGPLTVDSHGALGDPRGDLQKLTRSIEAGPRLDPLLSVMYLARHCATFLLGTYEFTGSEPVCQAFL